MRAGANARTKRCPYGATTIGHGALGEQPRDAGLAGEQVLADDDRVGSLAARQRLDRVGEGHAGERQVAHARIGAQRRVDLLAGVAQVGAAASGRLGAAGQRGRRGRHDVRHDDRRVVVCQLRREDEGVTAFGVTGEGDEDGGEHSLTVGLAVSAAIRERMPTRLWQSRSHLACQHRWSGWRRRRTCRHAAPTGHRQSTRRDRRGRRRRAGGLSGPARAPERRRPGHHAAQPRAALRLPPAVGPAAVPGRSRGGASPSRPSRPTRTSPSSTTR